MDFEWDENKNITNIKKHGVSFDRDIEIFSCNPKITASSVTSYGELRKIIYGQIEQTLFAVVYTKRESKIRIISVRKASKKKRNKFYEIIDTIKKRTA